MLKAADRSWTPPLAASGEEQTDHERLKKAIFQGGKHEVAGFSFNAHANYKEAAGKQFARVSATPPTRPAHPCLTRPSRPAGQAVMVRREPTLTTSRDQSTPSSSTRHHPEPPRPRRPDRLPHINIVTLAMIVPTTFMHMHSIQMDLKKEATREAVLKVFEDHSRIGIVRKDTGIKSNAQLREYTQDLGRPRTDLWENGIFEESVSVLREGVYCFQAIHQEADVIPENIDCIRALMGTVKDPEESIRMTNEALGLVAIG